MTRKEIDVWLRKKAAPEQPYSIPVFGPTHQLCILARDDAWIRPTLGNHDHAKQLRRQARDNFFHRKILSIGVPFVGTRRRENRDGSNCALQFHIRRWSRSLSLENRVTRCMRLAMSKRPRTDAPIWRSLWFWVAAAEELSRSGLLAAEESRRSVPGTLAPDLRQTARIA